MTKQKFVSKNIFLTQKCFQMTLLATPIKENYAPQGNRNSLEP